MNWLHLLVGLLLWAGPVEGKPTRLAQLEIQGSPTRQGLVVGDQATVQRTDLIVRGGQQETKVKVSGDTAETIKVATYFALWYALNVAYNSE
jgi:hypothetical protein